MTDDYLLVQRCRHDAEVFADVYRQYVQRVYAYLLSLTSSKEDAEDLTAQTFLAALESLDKFRKDGVFEAWIIGIARNKFIDYLRKTKHLTALEDIPHLSLQSTPSVEVQVEDTDHWQEVLHSMKQLKTERYEALTLRIFAGLSSAETAVVMNKTEGAINNLVYRAIQDLRRWLNDQ